MKRQREQVSPLTRPPGTLSPTGGEGWGEVERFMVRCVRVRHPTKPIALPAIFLRRLEAWLLVLLFLCGTLRAADTGGGDTVECANLIYSGTKSSVCFSEEFLSAVGSETSINTARKFK